jgi:hypothetical protein
LYNAQKLGGFVHYELSNRQEVFMLMDVLTQQKHTLCRAARRLPGVPVAACEISGLTARSDIGHCGPRRFDVD